MALAVATHSIGLLGMMGAGKYIGATARRSSMSLSSMSTKIELAVGDTTINEEFGAGSPDVRLVTSREISPTKLPDSGASQCLFTTLTRTPAHFPEFNFELRGFLEDRN